MTRPPKRTAKIEAWADVFDDGLIGSLYRTNPGKPLSGARIVRLTEAPDPSLAAEVRRLRKALRLIANYCDADIHGSGYPKTVAVEALKTPKPRKATR